MNIRGRAMDQQAMSEAGLDVLMSMNGREMAGADAVEADASALVLATELATVQLTGNQIQQATTGSDVRFELVAQLREKIAAGAYTVSASDVASRLMSSLRTDI
jgi:anti-sigma28 factor (negative regulator of flagellin synthesis)